MRPDSKSYYVVVTILGTQLTVITCWSIIPGAMNENDWNHVAHMLTTVLASLLLKLFPSSPRLWCLTWPLSSQQRARLVPEQRCTTRRQCCSRPQRTPHSLCYTSIHILDMGPSGSRISTTREEHLRTQVTVFFAQARHSQ